MAHKDEEPYSHDDATRRIKACMADGCPVGVSTHAKQRMAERRITLQDCLSALKAGHVAESTLESGTWRYTVQSGDLLVVVAFRSETQLSLVSVFWRNGR